MKMETKPVRRSAKGGLPPGALVFIGKKRTDRARVSVIRYDGTSLSEREAVSLEECAPSAAGKGVTWIDVDGLQQVEVIERLGERFKLHPLSLEDILNTNQRPKVEVFQGYLYIVLNMIRLREGGVGTEAEQVSIVLGPDWVLSFQETTGDVFDGVRKRLREGRGSLRSSGADLLAYSLVDAVVDNYFAVLERVGERIETLEEGLVADPAPKLLHGVHDLKRELIFLRKSVWPLREVIDRMQRGDSPLVGEETRVWLRDVYDHTIQVIDSVETYRDMVTGILDIYLSSVSNRLNEIMKVLAIISTVFIPMTFIAGVYGMNFRFMPELEWTWGYPFALLLMLVLGGGIYFYVRRKGWL